jgi:hypothetical protein
LKAEGSPIDTAGSKELIHSRLVSLSKGVWPLIRPGGDLSLQRIDRRDSDAVRICCLTCAVKGAAVDCLWALLIDPICSTRLDAQMKEIRDVLQRFDCLQIFATYENLSKSAAT